MFVPINLYTNHKKNQTVFDEFILVTNRLNRTKSSVQTQPEQNIHCFLNMSQRMTVIKCCNELKRSLIRSLDADLDASKIIFH